MKTFMTYTRLPLLAVLMAFSSCKENPMEPIKIDAPTKDQFAYLPLYINNTWAYVDSAFHNNTFANKYMTVFSISDFSIESGQVWWHLSIEDYLVVKYLAVGDSIYATMAGLTYFPPSQGDTLLHVTPVESTLVYTIPNTMTVPAGTFDSLVVFETRRLERGLDFRYFKPRVGMIRFESYGKQTGHLEFSTNLLYYKLAQ